MVLVLVVLVAQLQAEGAQALTHGERRLAEADMRINGAVGGLPRCGRRLRRADEQLSELDGHVLHRLGAGGIGRRALGPRRQRFGRIGQRAIEQAAQLAPERRIQADRFRTAHRRQQAIAQKRIQLGCDHPFLARHRTHFPSFQTKRPVTPSRSAARGAPVWGAAQHGLTPSQPASSTEARCPGCRSSPPPPPRRTRPAAACTTRQAPTCRTRRRRAPRSIRTRCPARRTRS